MVAFSAVLNDGEYIDVPGRPVSLSPDRLEQFLEQDPKLSLLSRGVPDSILLLIFNPNMSSGAPSFCNMGAEQDVTSILKPNPEERKQS
jgi:hypothetical protein